VSLNNVIVEGCTKDEGGGLLSDDSIVHISDSVFVGNSADFGGAVWMDGGSVTNTIFYDNSASVTVGGLLAYGDTTVSGCVFVKNSNYALGGNLEVSDSVFSQNGGGLMGCTGGTEVSRCLFASSGIWAATGGTRIEDSVIAGGGGLVCGYGGVEPYGCGVAGGSWARIERTTLVDGVSLSMVEGCGSLWLHGSVFWDGATMGADDVMYSLVEGGATGEGNISADPLFVGYPGSSGTWSDVYWDEGLFQTELTDETATWEPGSLAGLIVRPDTVYAGKLAIADNTETVIWAWGEASWAAAGDSYELIDLHLQPGSPAIDAGYGPGGSGFDMDGSPRWDDPSATNAYDCATDAGPDCYEYVDMGAYERQE
jgi:hypothetical protein